MLSNSSSSLFWPAHSITAPPFLCSAGAFHHRAAVSLLGRCIPSPRLGLFVRPANLIAAPHSLCQAGASHRRATISSFAGAFAANPPMWCCPILAGASPRRATIAYLGWRTPSLFLAGASPRHATITYIGWRIPSPCTLPFFAGASPRRATIPIFRRRIPSPCHHHSFWPLHPLAVPPLPTRLAHPIAMPPLPISAGASHRRTALSYFSR